MGRLFSKIHQELGPQKASAPIFTYILSLLAISLAAVPVSSEDRAC